MKKPYLEIAKIINTHGVHGELKLDPWCDSPDILKKITTLYLDGGKTPLTVTGMKSLNGGYLVASIEDISTVEAAIKLKNKILSAKREDIPLAKGAHFISDLVGLPVIDAKSGKVYGTLSDVMQNTVQELYAVKTESGKTVLMPAVPEFVDRVDEDEGIFITPIDGFFD